MSQKLDIPVLRIDVSSIHQVDPQNVGNLHSMWTVFSHCASALEEGKRLENLSWRVWNRETLCCSSTNGADFSTIPVSGLIGSRLSKPEAHQASIRNPLIKHTTSGDLEKMVATITEKKDLRKLPNLKFSSNYQPPKSETVSVPIATPSINIKDHSANFVRGIASSCTSPHTHFSRSISSIPATNNNSTSPNNDSLLKAKTVFALGGSSGEESFHQCDSAHNLSWDDLSQAQQKKKNAMFSFGGSSNEEETPRNKKGPESATTGPVLEKEPSWRQTTFQEEIARRTIREEVIVDDVFETDEEDEADENAIEDDDDSSEWEDSVEGSGNASIDDKNLFKRVDSRLNLTSRRSLITTMLHQHDRMEALVNSATNSKSTPAIKSNNTGPSREKSVSLAKGIKEPTTNLGSILEVPRSEARPIARQGVPCQNLALSPRTTRRNMLASELTVSLRQHLLWERKQKSQTANAVLKRRHTAQDIAQLRQYPEKSFMGKDDVKGNWDNCFEGGLGEYNSRGW